MLEKRLLVHNEKDTIKQGGCDMSILKRVDQTHIRYETEINGPYSIFLHEKEIIRSDQPSVIFPSDKYKNPVYEVHREQGIEYIREQLLDKTGVVNFRDIGGYYTKDGKQIRHGLFYRSAPLMNLTLQQQEYLDSLQIKTIFDLRSTMEVMGNEDYIPKGATYVHASGIQGMEADMMNGNFDFAQLLKQVDAQMLKGFIENIYKELPIQNPAYHSMMQAILAQETPLLFHCSAGKDRTGFAAALILLILGVDEETVMQDYLLSNELRKEANYEVFQNVQKQQSDMEALMLVYPQYLSLSFEKIKEVYGSFDNYIQQEFGIDETKRMLLKERCLYE